MKWEDTRKALSNLRERAALPGRLAG